ncbi:MAG: hypothetical protein AAF961_01220, partial [Planctomycetota bacterium]
MDGPHPLPALLVAKMPPPSRRLTDQQQRELCLVAAVGCDRQTACRYVGCSPGDVAAEMIADATFRARLLRAEASAKLTHLRNVHQASQDEKNWRASVWWLERRDPEQYGGQPARPLDVAQLEAVVLQIAEAIAAEVSNPVEIERLITRIEKIAE